MTIEQLKPFCSTDERREPIQKPFSAGDFTIATDGRILLKVPRVDGVEENPKAPSINGIEAIMPKLPDGVEWFDLGDVPPKPPAEICQNCSSGEHKCHECGTWVACEKCEGGEIKKTQYVPVGVRQMNGDYLRLLQTLPGVKVAKDFGGKKDGLCFKFDGGVGVVMPCNPKGE